MEEEEVPTAAILRWLMKEEVSRPEETERRTESEKRSRMEVDN